MNFMVVKLSLCKFFTRVVRKFGNEFDIFVHAIRPLRNRTLCSDNFRLRVAKARANRGKYTRTAFATITRTHAAAKFKPSRVTHSQKSPENLRVRFSGFFSEVPSSGILPGDPIFWFFFKNRKNFEISRIFLGRKSANFPDFRRSGCSGRKMAKNGRFSGSGPPSFGDPPWGTPWDPKKGCPQPHFSSKINGYLEKRVEKKCQKTAFFRVRWGPHADVRFLGVKSGPKRGLFGGFWDPPKTSILDPPFLTIFRGSIFDPFLGGSKNVKKSSKIQVSAGRGQRGQILQFLQNPHFPEIGQNRKKWVFCSFVYPGFRKTSSARL